MTINMKKISEIMSFYSPGLDFSDMQQLFLNDLVERSKNYFQEIWNSLNEIFEKATKQSCYYTLQPKFLL